MGNRLKQSRLDSKYARAYSFSCNDEGLHMLSLLLLLLQHDRDAVCRRDYRISSPANSQPIGRTSQKVATVFILVIYAIGRFG